MTMSADVYSMRGAEDRAARTAVKGTDSLRFVNGTRQRREKASGEDRNAADGDGKSAEGEERRPGQDADSSQENTG